MLVVKETCSTVTALILKNITTRARSAQALAEKLVLPI